MRQRGAEGNLFIWRLVMVYLNLPAKSIRCREYALLLFAFQRITVSLLAHFLIRYNINKK